MTETVGGLTFKVGSFHCDCQSLSFKEAKVHEGVANAVGDLLRLVFAKAESQQRCDDLLLLIDGSVTYVDQMDFANDGIRRACTHLVLER